MIKLDAGNVLLKPSHRRQMTAALKRVMRLGARLGDFVLNISIWRQGSQIELRAHVHDSAGDFDCRTRRHDWREALREISRQLAVQLHDQRVQQLAA